MQLYTSVADVDFGRLAASRQALAEEFRLLREEGDRVVRSRRRLAAPGPMNAARPLGA